MTEIKAPTRHTARCRLVEDEKRGERIRQRRMAHGIKSLREFAERSGVSREAITAAEGGSASQATYERLEAWLDRFEHEVGADDHEHDHDDDQVEFQISGNFGVNVTIKGPVADLTRLEVAAAHLLREIQAAPSLQGEKVADPDER